RLRLGPAFFYLVIPSRFASARFHVSLRLGTSNASWIVIARLPPPAAERSVDDLLPRMPAAERGQPFGIRPPQAGPRSPPTARRRPPPSHPLSNFLPFDLPPAPPASPGGWTLFTHGGRLPANNASHGLTAAVYNRVAVCESVPGSPS